MNCILLLAHFSRLVSVYIFKTGRLHGKAVESARRRCRVSYGRLPSVTPKAQVRSSLSDTAKAPKLSEIIRQKFLKS